jgi:GNAT superfamily N-acetyltransferase
MNNIAVKLATLQDLPIIRALWRDLVVEAPPSYPTNILGAIDTFTRSLALSLAAEPPGAFCFLGSRAGQPDPEGFFLYEIQVRLLGEPSRMAFVHYLYVAPAARGTGMSTALAQLACEHMLVQGVTELEATVQPGHETWWTDLGSEPYEVRCHGPIPRGIVGLDTRAARRAAQIGNSHDVPVLVASEPDPAPTAEEESSDEG